MSLHSGTQIKQAAIDDALLFNLGPTATALRTVRAHRGDVFVNTDLRYSKRDFCAKVDLEEEEAQEMLDWLAGRPGQQICALHFRRVGFGVRGDEVPGRTVEQAEVKRVLFATGNEPGLDAGRLYASHKHTGGPETFWQMAFHSANCDTLIH